MTKTGNRIVRAISISLAISALFWSAVCPGRSLAYGSSSSDATQSNSQSNSLNGGVAGAPPQRGAGVVVVACDVSISVATLSPTFPVTANQLFIPPVGIVGRIDVTSLASCWQANSDSSWLVVISTVMDDNDPPNGNGSVNFEIEPNFTPSRRIGRLFIGDEVFTVFQGARFNDVPETYIFFTQIGLLSAHGVTAGCGGGNFCPEGVTTRGQMAVLLLRSMGVDDPPTPPSQTFMDVPPSHPFFKYIEELAARGVTAGCGSGNFCPDEFVTREQMAIFIERALLMGAPPPTPTQQTFADVGPSRFSYPFIEDFAARGITAGCGGGNFCPDDFVTRGQTAAFLVKAFNL